MNKIIDNLINQTPMSNSNGLIVIRDPDLPKVDSFEVHGRYGNNKDNGDWEIGLTDNTNEPPESQKDYVWSNGSSTPFTFTVSPELDASFSIGGVSHSYGDTFDFDPNAIFIWGGAFTSGSSVLLDNLTLNGHAIEETVSAAAGGDSFDEIVITGLEESELENGLTLTGDVTMTFNEDNPPKHSHLQFHIIPNLFLNSEISVTDSWVEVNQQNTIIKFLVELSEESTEEISVEYFALEGTAFADSDYEAADINNKATLIFAPGEISKEIELTITGEPIIGHDAFEIFSRDAAYIDYKVGQDVDLSYTDLGYRVDEVWDDSGTDFQALGLTSDEDFFLVLANPTNATIAEREDDKDILEELESLFGEKATWTERDNRIFEDAEKAIKSLDDDDTTWTFAQGTIYDQAKDPVLAIRGTEPKFLDFLTDADPRGVGFDQYNANKDSIFEWLDEVSTVEEDDAEIQFQPHITGHSLGGALSQWVGANYSGTLGEVVTFNSPGIPRGEASKGNVEATHYITVGDLVSKAGEAFLPGQVVLSSYDKLSSAITFETHSVPVIVDSIARTGLSKPTGISSNNISSAELSSGSFTYVPDLDYLVLQLAAAGIGNLIEPGLGTTLGVALSFRDSVEEYRQRIGRAVFNIKNLIESNGRVGLPDLELSFGGDFDADDWFSFDGDAPDDAFLNLKSESLELIKESDAIFKVQGKLTASIPFIGTSLKLDDPPSATADFTGDKYIKISDAGLDVVGEFSIANIPIVPNIWELKEAKLFLNTEVNEVKGEATVLIPTGLELSAGLGFLQDGQADEWEFNYISLGVDNINKPIPVFPVVFFQSIDGKVDNIADSNPGEEPLTFGGGLGFTAGPKKTLNLPSWAGGKYEARLASLDLNGEMSEQFIKADGKLDIIGGLLTGTGSAELNWEQGFLSYDGSLSGLRGLVTIDNKFKANTNLDFTLQGGATVKLPDVSPFSWFGLDGYELGSANALLQYRNDNSSHNDYIAAWGSVPFFEQAGIRVRFNGDWDILGVKEIDAIQPASSFNSTFGNANLLPSSQAKTYTVSPETPWLGLAINWDNPVNLVDLELESPTGQVYAVGDVLEDTANINIIDELSSDTRRVIKIDKPEPGNWTIRANNTVDLGTVEFAAIGASSGSPSITIESVAPAITIPEEPQPNLFEIIYQADDADSDAEISFFYDDDNQGFDGILIADEIGENDGLDSYLWDATEVAEGKYYVYAMIMDEDNAPVFSYSPNSITVEDIGNQAPTVINPVADQFIEAYQSWNLNLILDSESSSEAVFSDPEGDTLTYTVSLANGNPLPDWLDYKINNSLDNNLSFSALPTLTEVGDYEIAITADDNNGGVIQQTLTLSVSFDSDSYNLIEGTTDEETLVGSSARDLIQGNQGKDHISGKNGDDLLIGGQEGDRINGNSGNDIIEGNQDNDRLHGGNHNDLLLGGDGNDTLVGGEGKDTLIGNTGNDTLRGGSGNDVLIGGNGIDRLFGDGGNDTFVIKQVASKDRVIVRDYTDSIDNLGLSDGLTFDDLTIANNNANTATWIRETATNNILAVLPDIDPTTIDETDFVDF